MGKEKGTRVKKYENKDLFLAIDAVKQGMPVKRAAITYQIPRTTLISRIKGWKNRAASVQTRPGRKVDLSEEVEKQLADHIRKMNKWGFGLTRKEVLNLVAVYVKENNIKTRFKKGIPAKDWFVGFSRRQNLSCKKPIKRQSVRTEQTTPEIIFGFFDLYENIVKELNLLNKPQHIFNLDETSLCSDASTTKVVSEKNKAVFRHTHGTGRSNTSVLFCISAAGDKLPPYILYKAKHLWDIWMPEQAYPNTGYAVTKSGWMTEDSFYSWFKNHFLNNCPKERPLLLIFDGHTSHISLKLIELAMNENISLLKLPPHTTHILQPLDSVAFGVFKKKWDERVAEWQRENYGVGLRKADLSILIGEVWKDLPISVLKRSFQNTGLYDDSQVENPINRKIIKDSIFKPDDIEKYNKKNDAMENCQDANVSLDNNLETVFSNTASSSGSTTSLPLQPTTMINTKSFEQLILEKISNNQAIKTTATKRRVDSSFADILTREDYLKFFREKQEETRIKKEQIKVRKEQANIRREELKKIKENKKQKIQDYSESGEEGEEEECCSDSDNASLSDLLQEEIQDRDEETNLVAVKEMKINSWAIINYATKKTFKRYIGKIVEINQEDDTVSVQCVRKKSSFFIWPNVIDADTVSVNDIYSILPDPKIGRRGEITFGLKFDGLNIQ